MQNKTSYGVLATISSTHFINDTMQSVLLALYPVFQQNFALSFVQIGLITVAFRLSASVLQPLIGHRTDKRAWPYSLPIGMGFNFAGLMLLAFAWSYGALLLSAVLLGIGSSIFHPESSRVARLASAGKHGLAQSIFQVGGNLGTAIGPLIAAFFILPHGQASAAWLALASFVGIILLLQVSRWSMAMSQSAAGKKSLSGDIHHLSQRQIRFTLAILLLLIFSKFVYLDSLNSYFTFYLIERFHLSIVEAQYALFIFLFGVAAGTILGGPLGDKIGRKKVIWFSILGVAPLTLLLPHVGLMATLVLVFCIGLILASAFPAIVVFGQELMPGKTGMISGLFFGVAFGIAGISAALLGVLADSFGIQWVYHLCAYLPLLGMAAYFLPELKKA